MSYLIVFALGWLGGWATTQLRNWWGNREDWRKTRWGPARCTFLTSHEVGFAYFQPDGWMHGTMNPGEWRKCKRLWGYQHPDGF